MNHPAVHESADLAHRPEGGMPIVTTDAIAGMRIVRVIGLVRGNTVRARNVGRDIFAGLRAIVGGEIREYTPKLRNVA